MAAQVGVVAKRTIVPMEPSTPVIRRLSKLDMLMSNFYMGVVYYYKQCHCDVEELNYALCATLSAYPIASGRLQTLHDGNLAIKCNDAGVRMNAAIANSTLSDWMKNKDTTATTHLYPCEIILSEQSISPLMMFQFTKFRCGGVAIGISWNHLLADFCSINNLMQAWSEAFRHVAVSLPPKVSSMYNNQMQQQQRVDNDDKAAAQDMVTQTFHVSREAVESCMAEATCTASTSIRAFLWKSINSTTSSHVTKMLTWISGQDDCGYFGNDGVRLEFAKASEDSISNVSDAAKLLTANPPMDDHDFTLGKETLLCSYAGSTPCYKVDFGYGIPIHVACSTLSKIGESGNVTVTVIPAAITGFSVTVTLPQDSMRKLKENQTFMARFVSIT